MRRIDREINNVREMLGIIEKCKVCRLGLSRGQQPYVLPMCFGYELDQWGVVFYFHGAARGEKLDILAENPQVCIEMDCDIELVIHQDPCQFDYHYRSLIARGQAEFITDEEQKKRALAIIMRHQSGAEQDNFGADWLNAVTVFKVLCEDLTAKEG